VKNLRLWQFMMACGLAREAEKVKTELAVPLDTCNLILVNQVPIAIRFRYDEKRFDVDGAYDIRHEIVKSRIDKAAVQGSRERLTQPGRLAIVYSHQNEADEIRQHIDFMQHQGCFDNNIEYLDLEDLPGVRGLKAIRVGIVLEAGQQGILDRKMTG
ncbi:MAG: GAF domain-containing protein, partial [Deltaproteobacteria bacterium]